MQNSSLESNPYIEKETKKTTIQEELGLTQVNPYIETTPLSTQTTDQSSSILGTFDTKQFVIGAVIGVAGAYLLTNEKAQKTLFKAAAKGSEFFNAGIEELKERYEDAKAELEAEQQS